MNLWNLPEQAKACHYVMVGGLWSNLAPLYFKPARERLKILGLSVEQAKIDTSDGVLPNADALFTELSRMHDKHKKKLVLIGHSKGTRLFSIYYLVIQTYYMMQEEWIC